jgi:hypothetical protein
MILLKNTEIIILKNGSLNTTAKTKFYLFLHSYTTINYKIAIP